MVEVVWGLLGPEKLNKERRTRTLGLGAAVRTFNDLAVPGLGGIWFGKQLFLSLIGIAAATKVSELGRRVPNIKVANATEAVACWLGLNSNGWSFDRRIRGRMKMQGRGERDLSFAAVSRPNFYVTQPFRPYSIQPLLALKFVEGSNERFNSLRCSALGYDFIDSSFSDVSKKRDKIFKYLVGWIGGGGLPAKSDELRVALSPLEPLSHSARTFLRERLIDCTGQDNGRRRAALRWLDEIKQGSVQTITWNERPGMISDEHWRDLQAGASFFVARDAAIALLNRIEAVIANRSDKCLELSGKFPDILEADIEHLRNSAQEFLLRGDDPSPNRLAQLFCSECNVADSKLLIAKLVERDMRVLQLNGGKIIPGAAFRGRDVKEVDFSGREDGEGDSQFFENDVIEWPEGISQRILNLYLLNLDLNDELGAWLGRKQDLVGVNDGN